VRRPLVIANWKMHGDMIANEALLSELLAVAERSGFASASVQAGIAAPSPYLFQVATRLRGRGFDWGAQDVSDQSSGAFTGEVSALMLSDFECQFCLVGHSECRARSGHTDARVALKVQQLLSQSIMPVICVGESLAERQAGRAVDLVSEQVRIATAPLTIDTLQNVAIAYEPLWAIGTGQTASAADAQAIHAAIRAVLAERSPEAAGAVRIVYGGSVKASLADDLFSQPDIDGALVGGASLQAQEFWGIVQAAHSLPLTVE
jgi:triosephosphate isomerase